MCEALIGLAGAFVGAAATLAAIWMQHRFQVRQQEKIDIARREMLASMLNNPPQGAEWRRLETLARVIGADHSETTRLLIEVGARGAESEENVWALKSQKPLHSPERE